jgi:hypothetical protein
MPGTRSPRDTESVPPTEAVERLAWVRHAAVARGTCGPLAEGIEPHWPARVHDLSAGGVCLRLRRFFLPGTVLIVSVTRAEPAPADTLVARVVHAGREDSGDSLVGCAFARPLDGGSLHMLRS